MDEATQSLQELGGYIESQLSNDVLKFWTANRELNVEIRPDGVTKVLKFLRTDSNCLFEMLVDICGVDYPDRSVRFEVVYNLLSLRHNQRVRIKLSVDEETPVASVMSIYSSASWFERECWDMYGIFFSGHSDLRRLLTDFGFDGHPFR